MKFLGQFMSRCFNVAKPQVQEFEKIRGRVEDEVATIECKVLGFPIPEIRWERQLEEESMYFK